MSAEAAGPAGPAAGEAASAGASAAAAAGAAAEPAAAGAQCTPPHAASPSPAPAPAGFSPSPNNKTYRLHARAHSSAAVAVASAPFHAMQNEDTGMLPRQKMGKLLEELKLDASSTSTSTAEVVQAVAGQAQELTFDQVMAIVSLLQSALEPSTSKPRATMSRGSPTPSTRRFNKSRGWMETGNVDVDGAVVSYLTKLDEHRKLCEAEKRYDEARVAAKRLADLRTQQVERLRQGLVASQTAELEAINKQFLQDTNRLEALWKQRVQEYEETFGRAVEEMRALHEAQRTQMTQEMTAKLRRPKPSREWLNQKVIEERLARTRQYKRASAVHAAANELALAESEQAALAFQAEMDMRMAKFAAKQQVEFDALLQRGARGRDALELKRITEREQRANRLRNLVFETEAQHRQDIVQLESFLDGQVRAGKAVPLKDEGAYRRKRELLHSMRS